MPEAILMVNPATVDLESEPIPSDWILGGNPVARSKKLSTSDDLSSAIVVWDCTPGDFHWQYSKDETIYVLTGEAFMTNDVGEERRFAAGDLGFFPAGYACNWRITEPFRKVAVIRETLWTPLGYGLKALNKLMRMTDPGSKSPLLFLLAGFLAATWR
jgi:uncharacterized cupin superfamily protein